ncbi:MAG: DUF1540 domain-containing protein [Thermacetogeniaceae bacterium]
MQGQIEKKNQHLPGVKCCVSSCYYYESGDRCHAGMIEIQPPNASNTQDTDCATFVSK